MPHRFIEVYTSSAEGRIELVPDPKERTQFINLLTSFVLPPEDIDRLRYFAGRLMRQSCEYVKVVYEFGGSIGQSP
jgi:hypothetical protein